MAALRADTVSSHAGRSQSSIMFENGILGNVGRLPLLEGAIFWIDRRLVVHESLLFSIYLWPCLVGCLGVSLHVTFPSQKRGSEFVAASTFLCVCGFGTCFSFLFSRGFTNVFQELWVSSCGGW